MNASSSRVAFAFVFVIACSSGSDEGEAQREPGSSTLSEEQRSTADPKAQANAAPNVAANSKLQLNWEADVGQEPLSGAAASLDELGKKLVAALNADDREALERLAVDRGEYERLFPALVNHPKALRIGAELSWANSSIESRGDLSTALHRYAGKNWTYHRLEPLVVEPRPGLIVYRNPKLVVLDHEGREHKLVMLGPVIEHQPSGGFKVLTYRDTP